MKNFNYIIVFDKWGNTHEFMFIKNYYIKKNKLYIHYDRTKIVIFNLTYVSRVSFL